MPILVPDQIAQLGGGTFGIIDDSAVIGGLHVVPDVAARDAIDATCRKEGMLAFVATGVTLWRLLADLETWVEFGGGGGGGGNPALLTSLADPTSFLELFCSPDGDDLTGDGLTPETAFATIQRACNEIPASCSAGTPMGNVQITCLKGAGASATYDGFVLGIKCAPLLTVNVIGDNTVTDGTFTLSAGVAPALTNAGTRHKASVYDCALDGTCSATFGIGSHWLDFKVGSKSSSFASIDGPKCTTTSLRLAERFDPADVGVPCDVRPVVCEITNDFGVFIGNENFSSPTGGTTLYVSGFSIHQAFSCVLSNVNLRGNVIGDCLIMGLVGAHHNNVFTGVGQYTDGVHCDIHGIFEGVPVFEGPTSEFFVGGTFRGVASGVAVYVGGPTAGRIGSATDIEFEFLDLEGAGVFQIQGAAARFGNHAPVTVDGNPGMFIARYGARVKVQTVVGACAGIPCIFESGCHGFENFVGLSGTIVNSSSAGVEWKTRSNSLDAGTTGAFSTLPHVDPATLIRIA